jgi:excisionase family DNA binding protein
MRSSASRPDYIFDERPLDQKPVATASSDWISKSQPRSLPTPDATPLKMIEFPIPDRLLNAREVAARLGVSERWVRDHTTRRSPKIRGVKLGTLMRYRNADVEEFMEKLTTSRSSLQPRFGG